MKTNRTRLVLDFSSRDKLVEWFEAAQAGGYIPAEARIFQIDSLDERSSVGVTQANTYIVRANDGQRHNKSRLYPKE